MNNYDPSPIIGKHYQVPNTVFSYSVKLEWFEEFPTSVMSFSRLLITARADSYERLGFLVIRHEPGWSIFDWKKGWGINGLYAYMSSTHGDKGFAFPESPPNGVGPNDVAPPYKLNFVAILACGSTTKVGHWKYPLGWGWVHHVSTRGAFVGYSQSVRFHNAPFDITVIPGEGSVP